MNQPAEVEDRPFMIALSQEEVIALVKYHTNCARRVPKNFGKAAMELSSKSLLGNTRGMKALTEAAQAVLAKHTQRAKGLLSILPK